MNFYMPTRLFTGDECISKNRDALEALGTSCVVVTEAAAGLASGALGDVDEASVQKDESQAKQEQEQPKEEPKQSEEQDEEQRSEENGSEEPTDEESEE